MISSMAKQHKQSNLFFIGNISERCHNLLFRYILLNDECTRDQVRLLLLCGYNNFYLNLFEVDSFWGRSRAEYINNLPGHKKKTFGNQELLKNNILFSPKIQLQFPSKFSEQCLLFYYPYSLSGASSKRLNLRWLATIKIWRLTVRPRMTIKK